MTKKGFTKARYWCCNPAGVSYVKAMFHRSYRRRVAMALRNGEEEAPEPKRYELTAAWYIS